jgi:hypothetical protein
MCRFAPLRESYPFVDFVEPERPHARLDARPIGNRCGQFLEHSPQMVTVLRLSGKYFPLTFNSISVLVSFCLVPFRAIS